MDRTAAGGYAIDDDLRIQVAKYALALSIVGFFRIFMLKAYMSCSLFFI